MYWYRRQLPAAAVACPEHGQAEPHDYAGSYGYRCPGCRAYVCQRCGERFQARHGALYCSGRCRVAAHRARARSSAVTG